MIMNTKQKCINIRDLLGYIIGFCTKPERQAKLSQVANIKYMQARNQDFPRGVTFMGQVARG